jgi:preprotein translocase subunit SecE
MARQTRAERRARREARERSMAGGGGGGGGELAVAGVGGDGRPERAPSQAGTGRPAHRNGLIRFVQESVGELRKVEWPGQNQVVQGTVVVIIACVIIGTYLYAADQIFNKLVSKVLLGQ